MFPRLLELSAAEGTVMRAVASSAWEIHLKLTLVLRLASGPLTADWTWWSVSRVDLEDLVWLLGEDPGVSRHSLHHASWMHLWANISPRCGTRIKILENSV